MLAGRQESGEGWRWIPVVRAGPLYHRRATSVNALALAELDERRAALVRFLRRFVIDELVLAGGAATIKTGNGLFLHMGRVSYAITTDRAHARSICLAIGAVAGVLSGLLGIGGALFIVPALVSWLSVTQHRAHGTSLAVVPLAAIASALIYGFHGLLDIRVAAVLAVGSMIGAHFGARLMMRVPAKQLKRGFGIFVLLIGIRMVVG